MTKVLFVCLGNICRSSMAQGVLSAKLEKRGLKSANIDSAGTSNWHIGNPPDSRAIAVSAAHHIDISKQKARQLTKADFENFDLLIAMDDGNLDDMLTLAPTGLSGKVKKCLDYSSLNPGGNVPDPYYGGDRGFDQVMTMLDDACDNIINQHF